MSHPALDEARSARPGEELDQQRVADYLRTQIPGLAGDFELLQFPGGKSNLTYLVRVGDTELVLRRPPHGTKAKSAHDMGREHRILSKLAPVFSPAPEPLAYCEDESLLGAPFYVMRRLHGIILRRDPPADFPLDAALAGRLSQSLIGTLAELHTVDYQAAGLADFGKPAGYVERQILGWNERYRRARTPDVPDCEAVMNWLEAEMPADSGQVALIHNDYKFDNVMLAPEKPERIIGVLDWEMATLGDPLMDLGCALSYWVQPDDAQELLAIRQGPTHLPGMWSRQQLAEHYAQRTGIDVGQMDFYMAYGLFRLAVIAQQIYYRYYHGQTQDERFKAFGQFAAVLSRQVERIMATR